MASSNSQETYRPAFSDRPKPHVSYGIPFPEACAKHAETTFNASRVYIISSASLAKNTDALQRLKKALGSKVAGVRIGMKPHTLFSEILEITAEAREAKADMLVTLGAGSLTDGAKIVAFALANDAESLDDLSRLYVDSPNKQIKAPSSVPIVSIPTSLSGGEYSNFAGGTEDTTHRKRSFSDQTKGPALIILDAELALTTPEWVWLSTGIRAVDHCIETLCSLKGDPKADEDAESGLSKIMSGLLRSKADSKDVEAHHLCQLGVMEAMSACSRGVPLGASHGIGHQLGPLGVGHGETSCILLPGVCKYNAAKGANVERQKNAQEVLKRNGDVMKVCKARGVDPAKSDLGDMVDAIIRELGMPRSLAEKGIGRDKFDSLAEHSLHDRWCQANPVPLTKKEQVMEILEIVAGNSSKI